MVHFSQASSYQAPPMSTVHPDPPRMPVRLRSEQEVLRSLRTLPQAHVFVRLSILDAESNRDREIDFLVLHPELGLVIVEVKGQGVEPKGDHWIRRQEDGREEILDETPGEQLQAQQWALLRWLKQESPGFVPQITRVLALPALSMPEGHSLGPDLPACRVLYRQQLARPFEALRMAVSGGLDWAQWKATPGAANHAIRSERLAELVRDLTPRLLPAAPLGEVLQEEGRLQDDQSAFLLDHLAENFARGRFHLKGAPGSGKSMLARQVARLWVAEGRRVLLVAFNRALTYATQVALEDLIQLDRVHVTTYHDLAANLLSQAGRLPDSQGGSDFFNTVLPKALERLLDDPNSSALPEWDALVVDEAQDLDPAWVRLLPRLLRQPDLDPVLLLEDPAQCLYREAHHDLGHPWRLGLSLRQHPALRRAACLAYPACGWEPPPAGDEGGVLRRAQSSSEAWRADLGRELETLASEGLHPSQVIILAPHRPVTLEVGDGDRIGPWPVNTVADWWEDEKAGHVRFGTVQGFKGLEAEVVIYLAPAYRRKDEGRLAYTAFSRARHRLIVLEGALKEPVRGQTEVPVTEGKRAVPVKTAPAIPRILGLPAVQQAQLLSALTAAKSWPASGSGRKDT